MEAYTGCVSCNFTSPAAELGFGTQVDWSISVDQAGASDTGGDRVSWEEGRVMTYCASK